MRHGKPIIGLAGGIGSGKSYVARLFARHGCLVLDADEAVAAAYELPEVRDQLRQWWGDAPFLPDGQVDRKAIARRVFNDPVERKRLEALLHPIVIRTRDQQMDAAATDPAVQAFVWDVPLLFETGMERDCDAVVFVDVPLPERVARVARRRGWDQEELLRRENLQMPLDKKRQMAHYVIGNTAGAADTGRQVQEVLSRILTTRNAPGTRHTP